MSSQVSDSVVVYRPNQRHELGWLKTWVVMGRNVVRARGLIWQLFKRDFFANYRKSFIGFTWIFLAPLAGIVSWVFLYKTGILNPGTTKGNYVTYVLVGSSMWGLFIGVYSSASATLSAASAFIMQVNYPHEALLFKQVGQQAAGFALTLLTNIVMLLIYGQMPSWKIVFLPLVILPLLFLGAGIGFLFSMISLVAVDLNRIVTMGMGLLLYATPVIYVTSPPNAVLQQVIKWNPLTYLICSARDIIIDGRLYNPPAFFVCAAGSFLLFMLSWRLFYVSEHKIVERML